MKKSILFTLAMLFAINSDARILRFDGCKSHLNYWSKKLRRSVDTEGFVANAIFDDQTGMGGGVLSLAYTDDFGIRTEHTNIPLACRFLEKTIPTVVMAGTLFCESLLPVVNDEKFFVSFGGYSGSTASTLHGAVSGHTVLIDSKESWTKNRSRECSTFNRPIFCKPGMTNVNLCM